MRLDVCSPPLEQNHTPGDHQCQSRVVCIGLTCRHPRVPEHLGCTCAPTAALSHIFWPNSITGVLYSSQCEGENLLEIQDSHRSDFLCCDLRGRSTVGAPLAYGRFRHGEKVFSGWHAD